MDDAQSDPSKELIATYSPASFGRGQQEVRDDTYRKAGKLDLNKFATTFCPYASGIIDVVSQILLPNVVSAESERRSVRAELHKLNVYCAPSGKFKAHVGTQRSEAQFGSLVVCLPVAYEGGELIVRNGGNDVVFDWSGSGSSSIHAKLGSSTLQNGSAPVPTDTTPSNIHWPAFYSDCEHEVLEVKSGHRLMLTYNLYIHRGAGNLAGNVHGGSVNPTQLPLYQTLKHALDTPGFMPRGGVFDIHLSHSYTHTIAVSNFLPSSLKGTDMVLTRRARALGLVCYVRPIISLDCYRYIGGEDGGDDVLRLMRSESGFPAYKKARWCTGDEYDDADAWQDTRAGIRRWMGVGHTTYGNEPGSDTEYSSAVLCIRVLPQGQRGQSNGAVDEPESMFDGVSADTAGYDPEHDRHQGREDGNGEEDDEDENLEDDE